MNKFKLSAVAILASLALTACGGGGGSNSNNNQPKESTINQTASNRPTIPGYDFPPLNINGHKIDKDDYALGTIKMSLDRPIGADKLLAENRQYSWNGIIVKFQNPSVGQQLINLDPTIQLDTETNRANLASLGLNPALNHTFKGYITSHDATTFFQTILPPDSAIPKSGKATYKGNAIRYDMVSLRPKSVGETVLNVDFDNKDENGKRTIEGKITTEDHRREIILQRTNLADDGKFNGTAVAEANLIYPEDVPGRYYGSLAGPNAEEVAGMVDFGSKEHVLGETPVSFSAVKQ